MTQVLSDDPTSSGTVKIFLPSGKSLSIGRNDDNGHTVDLSLEGLGMAKDHCILSHATPGKVFIEPRNAEAQTYVNGAAIAKNHRTFLFHHDRVVLGVCSHVMVFIDPKQANTTPTPGMSVTKNVRPGEPAVEPSYDQAVREIMVRRVEKKVDR